MNERRRSLALALVLASVAVLAWFPRSVEVLRHPRPAGGWFSCDPDGLYHARRVERALGEGLHVAETDPRLAYPEGARIPWPPYYDLAVAVALKPFAPEDAVERHAFVERAVASLPRIFGIACALLAALAAWRWGVAAALIAGATVAWARGTVNYSVIGTGDHHAWIALLAAALTFGMSHALASGALASRSRAAALGAALGVLAGVMLGSWVAALLYVINFQIVLGWMIWRRARTELSGVATFGLAFHVAAALVLLPAVLSSPWRAEFPWMVVNLSWFHPLELALGALVFVPLVAFERTALAPRTRLALAYPLLVAVALGGLALVAVLTDLAPARGIAEGLAWVSRADAFMDIVQESAPLVGARAEQGVLFLALGYGVVVLPFALAFAAWRAFARGADELLPWVVAVATLLPQALAQRRFADPLMVPMGVVLAFGAAGIVASSRRAWLAPVLVAAALLAQFPSARSTWKLSNDPRAWVGSRFDHVLAERRALEWIDAHAGAARDWSVLSHWDRGHSIEWVAQCPSVSSNFGSYIGADSYADPSRFFLCENEADASAVLERRRVRFIYAPANLTEVVRSMVRAAAPQLRERYAPAQANGAMTPAWYSTMAGRLLFGGVATDVERQLAQVGNPLETLRLVHVSPLFDGRRPHPVTRKPLPAGFVWERVAGAQVEITGAPDAELELALDVAYPANSFVLRWRASAIADALGRARIRVPYHSDAPNGDGAVVSATWKLGARSGALVLPESAVREGRVVQIE